MSSPNTVTDSALKIYECPVCLESNDTAVSLNPCGHEFHEDCAKGVIKLSKRECPVCKVKIENFRPAFATRQAVELFLSKSKSRENAEEVSHPQIKVVVKSLLNKSVVDLTISRNETVCDLAHRITQEICLPVGQLLKGRGLNLVPMDGLKKLDEYVEKSDTTMTCIYLPV